jgi:hypothetical protein
LLALRILAREALPQAQVSLPLIIAVEQQMADLGLKERG